MKTIRKRAHKARMVMAGEYLIDRHYNEQVIKKNKNMIYFTRSGRVVNHLAGGWKIPHNRAKDK